ncbi:MAG: peptide ABC transporter substrate-binding protein [Egibacteraceae bacterium]
MRVRFRRPAVLLLALGLLAGACGGGQQDGRQTGGEFSVYIHEPQSPLIPSNTNESEGAKVLKALFTGLVVYDPKTNAPVNAMAEAITSPDQKVWTIKIRSGWKFHDGTLVTAQSYVNSWNFGAYGPNAQSAANFYANIFGYRDLQCGKGPDGRANCATKPAKASQMSGLKVIDDTTFQVTLSEPFSQFPVTLGYYPFLPVPDALMRDPKAYGDQPIGNGPFMMDGPWQHNRAIRMQRFLGYAGKPAKVDAVEFRIYTSDQTAYNDLVGGQLDIMDQVPPDKISVAKQDLGGRYFESPRADFVFIGFPLYRPEFGNPKLRIAFSKAIDRAEIAKKIFNGARTPAFGYVSPLVIGARPNACGDNCAYDPAAAKKLFDEAGGLNGQLELWFNSGGGHEQWMEAVANQLSKNLGIKPPLFKQFDFSEYLSFIQDKQSTGPYRLGWIMDYPSPQDYLEPVFSTNGSSNNFGYSNPQVDRLIAQGNAASSIDQSVTLYHQAEDQILKDMPAIPLFYGRVNAGYSERVGDVVVDAFGNYDVANVTLVR